MKQKGGQELGVALINNLPMLFDFSEVKNFRSLIDRQAAQRKLARQHQRCSLTAIFRLNVSFAATTLRNDPMLFEGCQVGTLMPKQFELANDLYLCFQANKRKCEFRLDYKTELFNAEFLSAFLRCYDRLRKSGKCKLAVQKNSFKEWVAIEKESLASMASKRFWMKEIAHYLGEQCPLFNPLKNIGKIDYLPWPEVLVIPSDITTLLINLAKRHAVSVKIICFSAFLQLISEHVSQRRFIVGVVTNGRTARLRNPLHSMGLFWNLLPFGVDVDRSEFHRFDLIWTRLQKLEKQMAYPFTQISQDCKVKALFEAVFNFVNFHNVDQALVKQTSLSLERVDVFDNFHFPLNFTAAYSSINFEY